MLPVNVVTSDAVPDDSLMILARRFDHTPTVVRHLPSSQFWATCQCGWQSTRTVDELTAMAAAGAHGLDGVVLKLV